MGKIYSNVTTCKINFYIHLNMEDNADAYYEHAKRVCKDFEIKSLGEN